MASKPEVAVYYFPNYHVDPRNEIVHGKDWTEWDLVKCAQPRFEGHAQPKVPVWGYQDESDPAVFAQKIDAAADHCVDTFLFDWYWYNDGPYIQGALEKGFLQAPNAHRLKFALMWANHDWVDIHPTSLNNRGENARLLYPGAITQSTWDTMTDYIIETYFKHPSYWKIDNRPVFMVYELFKLVDGLGGADSTRQALEAFREKTRKAGFDDLHINAVVWGVQILPGEKTFSDPRQMLETLGFDSVASYVWVHHVVLPDFPATDYAAIMPQAIDSWAELQAKYGLPYFPNVTMGWDASPRTLQSDSFENRGYPFGPVMTNNTPANFKKALQAGKEFLEASQSQPKILTINAWNEWTEGSYLEPDTDNGMGYLEAIREVFGG